MMVLYKCAYIVSSKIINLSGIIIFKILILKKKLLPFWDPSIHEKPLQDTEIDD